MATTKSAQLCDAHTPLELICGKKRTQVEVVFETYGTLSASRDNAILVNHALTGDAHAASTGSDDEATGCSSPLK